VVGTLAHPPGVFGGAASITNAPEVCTVPRLRGRTLPAAKRTIALANCRVGTIRRAYSKAVKRGRVISQKPRPSTVLPNRGKVNLVLSRGRRLS
jgi:beta-lactam-binding protein with PASTA domain